MYFANHDPIIENKLLSLTQGRKFVKAAEVNKISSDMISYYADSFCEGNYKRAKTFFEGHLTELRKVDAAWLSYFGGICTVILPLVVFFMANKASISDFSNFMCWLSAFPVFRLTFMLSFVIGGAGLCIQMFRKYQVNYIYILELDPHHKVTHMQLYRVSDFAISKLIATCRFLF